jgi:hypothetical protein
MIALHPDQLAAREWAFFYRSHGTNPLPSSRRRKLPAIPASLGGPGYRRFWLEDFPASGWLKTAARNVQIPCGVRWGLAVVDLDGPEAIAAWEALSLFRGNPPTWAVRSGSGVGMHLWYRLPARVASCPSRLLWGLWDPAANAWVRTSRVELLGDRKLVVAPPSIHGETGLRYEFLPGHAPSDLPRPAELPAWVLAAPPCEPPGRARGGGERFRAPTRRDALSSRCWHPRGAAGLSFRLDDVDLAVRPHRLEIVRSWGLRLCRSEPDARGYVPCRAIDREDRHPSASFQSWKGIYSEGGGAVCIPFFSLGSLIGGYRTWPECVNDLGALYCPEKSRRFA